MARPKESVRIDGDYINAYLHRNDITAKEFSQKLLYCDLWWTNRKGKRQYVVPRAAAIAMCEKFGFQWKEIVLEEFHSGNDVPEKQEESAEVSDFAKILYNIDQKLEELNVVLSAFEQRLEKLKWLER